MIRCYLPQVILSVLLASLLGACASKTSTLSPAPEQATAAIEMQPPVSEPVTEPVMQPEIKHEIEPAPAMLPKQEASPYAREDIIWIQRRLQDLGYYNGAIDGSAGQGTRTAIESYQQDQGVTPDGKPSAELREFMWRNGG